MKEQYKKIEISSKTIGLGQFLKLTGDFESGGFIKNYLQDVGVLVNNEHEDRRGRKLQINDVVEVIDGDTYIVVEKEKN